VSTARIRDGLILLAVAVVAFVALRQFSTVAVYFVYTAGGLVLLTFGFVRKRLSSRWAQSLFLTGALLITGDGALHLLRWYSIWVPPLNIQLGLSHTFDFIGGTVLGIFIALIASGELSGRKASGDTMRSNQALEPTADRR
jgi:hypothetical protein